MSDYGAAFYDHFSRFIGAPKARQVFRQSEEAPSIQILRYEKVFPGCAVSNSLGLSRYEEVIGEVAEVTLVTDAAIEASERILANALFFIVQNRIQMDRGMSIAGVPKIDPGFAKEFDKEALYFTIPYAFPMGYEKVKLPAPGTEGFVYSAMFVSRAEHDFVMAHGADAFEDLLEKKGVDPFDIKRASVV